MKMCIVLLVINSVLLILSLIIEKIVSFKKFYEKIIDFKEYLKFKKWFNSQLKNIKDIKFGENLYLVISFSPKNESEIFE